MLIFGALISPYVRKVCLAAEEKGLSYELVLAGPGRPNADHAAASPFGKIPAIKDGDYLLSDSTAIVTYFDAEHPEPALLPADPRARGKTMWFDEYADTIVAASGLKVLFNRFVGPKLLRVAGDEALAAQGEAELPPIYAYLESVAPERGWLVGSDFTLGDIAVASVLRSLTYVGVEPKPEKHPRILAWYDRVRERPSWQRIAAVEDAPRR